MERNIKEKLYLKGLRILILSSLFTLILTNSAYSQMECRSMLGAHLTPFKKDVPILWAVEGTMAPGMMTSPYDTMSNAKLNGGMILAALDFTFWKKHNFYFEGGYKNWKNSELVSKSNDISRHLGVRQAFYSYKNDRTKIVVGLHETKLGDYFLVDERVFGASLDHEMGAFSFNFRAASVLKNFARMGQFCGNRHIYGIMDPNYTENIGEKIGETNFSGFVLNWNPNYVKPLAPKENNSDDEFSSDTDEFSTNDDFYEFADGDEFSEGDVKSKESKFISIQNISLIVYDEFGEIIPDNKLYIGSLVDFKLPNSFFFQTGTVYQNMKDNNAFVYIFKLGKSKSWKNASNTKLGMAYIGKVNIDNNALFQPLFSNLFLGEVMRMDAVDFPLWNVELKHNFPGKIKFHIAVKAVGQLEANKTNEQDLELGIKILNNHLKVTGIFSHVSTNALPDDFMMARLEIRLAF